MKKNITRMLLAIALFLSANVALADMSNHGTCGANLTWSLREDGVLTISGSGAMDNWGTYDSPFSKANNFYGTIWNVVLNEGVTSIGSCAFVGCSELRSIEIPSTVTSIGMYAFQTCNTLYSINIPSSLISIGERAFDECSGLSSITVDDNNPVYDSRNNCNAIIETATNTLLLGCTATVIPYTVKSIDEYAFPGGCFSSSIEIPSSVTSIGMGAFRGCYGFTEVYAMMENPIPYNEFFSDGEINNECTLYVPEGSVQAYQNTGWKVFGRILPISGAASGFCGANGDDLTWTLTNDGILTISGDGAMADYPTFKNRNSIKVVLNEGVTSIGDMAFYCCTDLSSIEIPSTLARIGDGAFSSCRNLASIEIPSSVTTIEGYAFQSCI